MKRVYLLLVGLLCLSVSAIAGEVITNDTGEEATGLRVSFSNPVLITAFGDILTSVDPQMLSFEFVFSGGTVEPWDSHWFNYAPTTASVVEYEWLDGSTSAPQGLPSEQRAALPVVTGTLLNPDYFAHPAYVMQGDAAKDAVFALPLSGIEELAFYPTSDGADLIAITWSVEVSHPEGIEASIEDNVLYILGRDSTWAGYGEVVLEAVLGDSSSSVAIPVSVFCEDRTLINAEGKKDYFVPWSSELDVNRILSVEAHMQTYNKDEGSLDRTVRWSQWKKMEYIKGAQVVGWTNSNTWYAWTEKAQYLLVDNTFVELANIGCNGINYWRLYALESMDCPFPTEVFDGSHPAVAITGENLRYLINEAHRNGFQVIVTPHVAEPMGVSRDHVTPPSFETWFDHYGKIVASNASICRETGADGLVMGNILYMPSPIYWGLLTIAEWNNFMLEILDDDVRTIYLGPAIYMHGSLEVVDFRDSLPLLREVDIVGGDSCFSDYPVGEDPTVGQVESHMTDRIHELIDPMSVALNKPILMNEGGLISQDDALRREDFSGIPSESAIYDGEEQRIWYEAYFSAELEFDYVFGFGWFHWPLLPGAGGVGSIGLTPRLKPAETEIRKTYLPNSSPPIIQVDGDIDDWAGRRISYEDIEGDSSSVSSDIVTVRGEQDEDYHYLLLEFAGTFNQDYAVQLLFDLDNDSRTDLPAYLTWAGEWFAMLFEDTSGAEARGRADIEPNVTGTQFELRFHNALLNDLSNFRVQVKILNTEGKATDVTDFFWLHAK